MQELAEFETDLLEHEMMSVHKLFIVSKNESWDKQSLSTQ